MPEVGRRDSSAVVALLLAVASLAVLPAGNARAASIAATSAAADSNDSMADADALCSVREAVLAMNQGGLMAPTNLTDCSNSSSPFGTSDTITLSSGTHSLTLTGDAEEAGATGDLDVLVNNLTINGNAANPPTIQGNIPDGDRVLHAAGDINLTLQNLIVDDGELDADAGGQLGGNVFYEGGPGKSLLLDNVDVTNGLTDTNAPADNGGGIAANNGGQVTIQNDSLIQGNVAGPSTGNTSFGGGIFIAGNGTDLVVSASTINANDASVGVATGGIGGGIAAVAAGTSIVDLSSATVSNNRAGGDPVNPTGGNGGGIAAGLGGAPTITITGGSITNNSAGGGAGNGAGFGGGIYVDSSTNPLTISGGTISDNLAGGNGGTGSGDGGGIETAAPTVIQNSTVSSNDAGFHNGVNDATDPVGNGGGIHVVSGVASTLNVLNSSVNGNRAGEESGNGGGIRMESMGNLTVTDSVISGNQAGQSFGNALSAGGGIQRPANAGLPSDSILRTVVSGNSAGGGGTTMGGGLFAGTRGTFTIRESTVSGNTSHSSNASGVGGGLELEGGSSDGSHILENVTVSNNMATAPTVSGGAGGGIAVDNGAGVAPSVSITYSTIAANTAQVGGLPGGGNLQTGGVAADAVDLLATIISGGVSDATQENCALNIPTAVNSVDFNVEGPPSSMTSQCGLDQPNDVIADPLLGGLADNGGPDPGAPSATQPLLTRALLAGSPAINRVTTGCPPPTTDERGFTRPRPAGGLCDSGAFEVQDTDGDGILDTSDSCPTLPGPASNAGCPLPLPPLLLVPATTENPECATLRAKLKKAKSKKKKRKLRKRLRKLGC